MLEQQGEAQAGDSPRGAGGRGRGPSLGPPRLQGRWETPTGSGDIRFWGHPHPLASQLALAHFSGALQGPARRLDKSDPSHLAVPAPPSGTPYSSQASLFSASVFARAVPGPPTTSFLSKA